MKKFTLVAAAALVGLSASAQFNVDPSNTLVSSKNPKVIYPITVTDGAMATFEKGGASVVPLYPDGVDRNLWIWDNTLVAGDSSYPAVDMEEGGYIALNVGTVGWSGAGFNCAGVGVDLSAMSMETRFHIAYMTPTGNGPASFAMILLDGDSGAPAKVSLGAAFNDNGAVFPAVGAALNDDWQGLDISLGDLKKMWPDFNLVAKQGWTGNIFSFLAGGVAGQSFAFDATYFYNLSDSGVGEVAGENVDFVVTRNTVNVNGANGIALYNLAGQQVKATEGCVLGLNGLEKGVYVAKCGKKVQKVVVR